MERTMTSVDVAFMNQQTEQFQEPCHAKIMQLRDISKITSK